MEKARFPWDHVEPNGRLLRPSEVVELTGLSRSQIYQMIADRRFPPFIKVSLRASALPLSWYEAFVKERAKEALALSKTPSLDAEV